jgi:hypothetical protein
MTKIKLLHSYLYIENTKNLHIKNNKIYNNNNDFVCGLSNLPSNNQGIKIIIEKNLIKKKQSKKIFNTYYEKNNVKLYLEFDFKNKSVTKNKEFLIKLIKNNYLNFLNLNDNLFNSLCINKNYHKYPFHDYNITLQDQNIIKIFNLYFDLSKNIIKDVKICKSQNYDLNFNILYSDYLLGTIKILNSYKLKNIIVICDNVSIQSLWNKNLKGINFLIIDACNIRNYSIKDFNTIIFCDLQEKKIKNIVKKYFKYKKSNSFLYVYTNCEEETIMKFVKKFYCAINIKDSLKEIYNITIQTLYNYSKCIIYHKFFDNFTSVKNVKKIFLKNTCKINPLIKYIRFDIKKDYVVDKNKSNCPICLDDLWEDNFIYLNCGHKFCKNCISNLKEYNLNCSISSLQEYNLNCSVCRTKITYNKKNVNEKSLFDSKNWYYVGDVIKKLINEIQKSNYESIILLENLELYPLLNTLLFYYSPKKFNIFCDYNNIFDKLNTEKKIVNLFYLKSDNKLKKRYNYLCLFLKNFYNTINYFEYNVIDY